MILTDSLRLYEVRAWFKVVALTIHCEGSEIDCHGILGQY